MALIPAGAFKMGDTLNGENKPKPTVNVIYEHCLSNNSMLYPFCWRGNRSDTANLDELAEQYRLRPPKPLTTLQMGVFINLVKRGECLLFRGPYDRAIQDFDQAIRLKPNDASFFFYHRSIVLRAQGQQARAVADFAKTTQLSQQVQIYNQNTSSMIVGPNCMPNRGITMAIMEVRMKYIGFGNAGLNAGLMNNLGHR